MSDVVAVALVTGLSSLGSAGVGALATYKVSKRGAEATVATAQESARVELAKVEAENERLREQHREDERRNRQGTYHRLLAQGHRLGGVEVGSEEFSELATEWRFALAGVQLFGDPAVVRAAERLQRHVYKMLDMDRDEWRKELSSLMGALMDTMRADVGSEPRGR